MFILDDGIIPIFYFLGWEFNWPVTLALTGYPVRTIPSFENGLYYYGIVFFAKDKFIEGHKNVLEDFIKITIRGWKEVLSRPEYYAEYIVDKWYPESWYINKDKTLTLKQQIVELILRKRYLQYGVGEEQMFMMNPALWEKGIDIAERFNVIISDSIQATDVFTMDILNSVYADTRY